MYKDNYGIFLAQAVSGIVAEVKLQQQLVHGELRMILKALEPGHQDVRLGRSVVRAQPGQRSTV